MRFSA